ncbi:Sec63 [Sarracenia purpurea var. burkii]
MTFGHSNPFIKDREQQDRLREASLSCSDKHMQSYILYGRIRTCKAKHGDCVRHVSS